MVLGVRNWCIRVRVRVSGFGTFVPVSALFVPACITLLSFTFSNLVFYIVFILNCFDI